MKSETEVYDFFGNDISNLTREELYHSIRVNQEISLNAIAHFDWIFEAFIMVLENTFHFGKQRMKKFLKQLQKVFNYSGSWSFSDNPESLLEKHGFKIFFHNGKILLRDLNADSEEYFNYLNTDLRLLAQKLDRGNDLSEKEKEVLRILKKEKE